MSKELEALETLKDMLIGNGCNDSINDYVDNLILPIKQALTRLESIDNSNPSEALERINTLIEVIDDYEKQTGRKNPPAYISREILVEFQQALLKAQEQEKENSRAFGKDIINLNKTLKQTIDKPILYASRYGNKYIVPQKLFEEQEKVLEIIKEKRIDIESFYKTFIEDDFNYLDYQIMYGTYGLELLTKEEFDLLKRWLG